MISLFHRPGINLEFNQLDIWVIGDCSELTNYPGFYEVDKYLGKEGFENFFHYQPKGAEKFSLGLNSQRLLTHPVS
ncbi:hypothetical protein [Mucilaginibacter sp. BT774]|uniref:hypothetical protein n=1 Tax=Mucilaginibacter sp. BT774 TaxID=3062276 RepID=UPI002677504A|nr:hypothetical protein [Mucilaginibacter sp. BT774]MDO3626276.1 hypothetical protein [Mucilaginibacter sp. BT774]